MKNRSRTDIIVAILDTAIGGSSKTKIMYDAYVSYAQLKEYLSILIAKGLLEPIEEENPLQDNEKRHEVHETLSLCRRANWADSRTEKLVKR